MTTRNARNAKASDDDDFQFAAEEVKTTKESGRGGRGAGRKAEPKLPELTDEDEKFCHKFLDTGSHELDANRMARIRSLMVEESAVKGQSGIPIDGGIVSKSGDVLDPAFASTCQYAPAYSSRDSAWYYRITVDDPAGGNLGTPSGQRLFLDEDNNGFFLHFLSKETKQELIDELEEREAEYVKTDPCQLLGFLAPRQECSIKESAAAPAGRGRGKADEPAAPAGRRGGKADEPAATSGRGGRKPKADKKVVDMIESLIELVGQEAFDLALDEITK